MASGAFSMQAMLSVVGLLMLLIFAQALFEGGVGDWLNWACRKQSEGKFTASQRLSQVFFILALIAFLIWWTGIAVGVFPVP